MKKENILVVALVVIALGAVAAYNSLRSPDPTAATPSHGAVSHAAAVPGEGPGGESGKGPGIDWKDYTPGMAMARDKGKSIFLYFHAPWCTYCTKLKLTTFKDEKVLAYLEDHFVSIQVDTDQNRNLAAEWRVTGLPTLWFLDAAGKKIDRMPGYVTGTQMLQILKYIHTQSYKTMEFHEFVKQS